MEKMNNIFTEGHKTVLNKWREILLVMDGENQFHRGVNSLEMSVYI